MPQYLIRYVETVRKDRSRLVLASSEEEAVETLRSWRRECQADRAGTVTDV